MAKKQEKPKPQTGRPSKYDPKYCDEVIAHMRQGLSFETFAAKIDVNRDTIYEWRNQHDEFSDAVKKGFDLSQTYWEQMGVAGMAGKIKNFNATIWIFNMKNRFKWRDRQPEEVDVVVNNYSNMSEEDLDAQIQEKQKNLRAGSND